MDEDSKDQGIEPQPAPEDRRDPDEAVRLAREEIAKDDVRKRLLRITMWFAKTKPDAKDLLHAVVQRVIDPADRPWIHRKWSFSTHFTYVARHTWRDGWQTVAARELADGGLKADHHTPSPQDGADDALHEGRLVELLRELGKEVLLRVEPKYPLAARVFRLSATGVEDIPEQVAILGCTEEEIYDANRTLKRFAAQVRAEWDEKEARRMKALRERATKKEGDRTGAEEIEP